MEERITYLMADQDKKALTLIFDNYGSLLLNVIMRVIKDRMMAEDVLQQVLIKVWNHSNTFDSNKGSIFTWLVTISRNAAIDKTRTKDFRLTQESERSVELVNITERKIAEDPIEKMYVDQLVNQLPEEQKKLISMSFFEGYSHREISDSLDMPLGTVKTRIRLAINHLRGVI
ncbi:RNA polymerase sigma factor [Algoriphagus sediminis]|uniref:RNA polymerase sigma factor n=1 Tax=Algoriphagus sediminis TaxID=3057113 RepID=A0ABT7YA81_9BACT|nr:sigma-70 family RNA polymerase sigma factor [Algoriphagus sediminis]MDN3203434.1 sigma-70 family RNA polymerase sigma factor [Algoriphagus sediminis]